MLNKFLVAGRMTADPEIQTKGENRLCKFTIACERPKRKGEEKPETDFFTCIAWNRNADVVVDWFGKGDIITLVGAVHINQYEKNGEKRNSTEVKMLRASAESDGYIDRDTVHDLIYSENSKPVLKPRSVKISNDTYVKYFRNGTKPKEIAETIEKALEFYFKNNT